MIFGQEMSVATHYDTLQVTRDAPAEVIQAAYKALAQKYHPDRNVGNAAAGEMMQLINESYRTLSDGRKKAEHDAWIRQQDPPKPPPALTPQEQELKKKSDEAAAEAKKWADWAGKTAAEARAARDKANKVAEQLKTCAPDKKSAFETMYAREDAAAKEEEKKALDAANKAQQAAAIAAKHAFSKDSKPVTHYDTLKVAFDAPPEVIQAAARVLTQKYSAPEMVMQAQAVAAAYALLTDPAKKAAHDAAVRQQMPKEAGAGAATARKPTGREIAAKEIFDKANADAVALETHADRVMKEERALTEKAQQAAADAAKRAKDADYAKWKTYADKLAADALQEKNRSAKAAAKAAEARLKAQAAQREMDDAKAAGDREAAMWGK